MLTPQTRVRARPGDVAGKVIDGEAIIMNLGNGLYFSSTGVGGRVWSMVERRASVEEMVAHVERAYDVDPEHAKRDVLALVEELLDEDLVVVVEGSVAGNPAGSAAEIAHGDAPLPYEPPVLHRYDDMAAMLALDPPMPQLGEADWVD